ncbi:MAG: flagellin [Planctomycetes bacterium]|nr:flagellin [Planctomycetota bacterium]
MGLTVTNINTLSLLNILNRTSADQSNTLTRLSTGSRINRGSDDPAGLIASRVLDTELTAVNGAIQNNQRTDSMLNVADKAINEVANLVNEIKSLALQSANEDGISADELAANQSQIDEALTAIDRIIGSTEFNGKKLLDGSLGITTTGVDTTKISDLRAFARDPNAATSLTVSLDTAATQAQAALATAVASSDTSVQAQGKDGAVTINITASEALSSVEAKIDAASSQTGVDAFISGGSLYVQSSDYGSSSFVRSTIISGDVSNFSAVNDSGSDAVVTVNGQATAVDGLTVNYTSNGVSLTFNLTEDYNDGTVTGSEAFNVEASGGATFQLGTTSTTRSTIGVDGLYASQLGSAVTGYLETLRGGGANSLVNNPNQAAKIATEAAGQLAKVQGRIGGFQKFQVKTALAQQNAAKEGLTSALSTIRDVDYATETATLNRQNVLLQSAISLLGLANQQSSQILSLLR